MADTQRNPLDSFDYTTNRAAQVAEPTTPQNETPKDSWVDGPLNAIKDKGPKLLERAAKVALVGPFAYADSAYDRGATGVVEDYIGDTKDALSLGKEVLAPVVPAVKEGLAVTGTAIAKGKKGVEEREANKKSGNTPSRDDLLSPELKALKSTYAEQPSAADVATTKQLTPSEQRDESLIATRRAQDQKTMQSRFADFGITNQEEADAFADQVRRSGLNPFDIVRGKQVATRNGMSEQEWNGLNADGKIGAIKLSKLKESISGRSASYGTRTYKKYGRLGNVEGETTVNKVGEQYDQYRAIKGMENHIADGTISYADIAKHDLTRGNERGDVINLNEYSKMVNAKVKEENDYARIAKLNGYKAQEAAAKETVRLIKLREKDAALAAEDQKTLRGLKTVYEGIGPSRRAYEQNVGLHLYTAQIEKDAKEKKITPKSFEASEKEKARLIRLYKLTPEIIGAYYRTQARG